jgi:hypothetical protein
MNSVQILFEFQVIVNYPSLPYFHPPKRDHKGLFDWFDQEIDRCLKSKPQYLDEIDYWIGITSEKLGLNLFVDERPKDETHSSKPLAMITSFMWERVSSLNLTE